jgi:DNA-binding MarR family transcriptional regulator
VRTYTDDGRSKVDKVFTINLSMYRKILDGLRPDEQRTFDQSLITILTRLDELSGTRQPAMGRMT